MRTTKSVAMALALSVLSGSAVAKMSAEDVARLRPVFDPALSVPVRAHFLAYPRRHAQRAEVAQFIDWLGAQADMGAA